MKTVLLCGKGQEEVDCINVAAILIRFDDGKTVILTEGRLRQADLEDLDGRRQLEGWQRKRADEFLAGTLQMEG